MLKNITLLKYYSNSKSLQSFNPSILKNMNKRNFSIYNSDRDKKLSQFFKLPSINNLKEDQIFDKSENEEISVLDTYDQEMDKIDLMKKIIKKRLFDEERKIKVFLKGNSDRENIKITQTLIEKLRLNKEFKFSEEFKRKEILNEYGNYDKYFENYKIIKDKQEDLMDDGQNRWEQKYRELQQKYNNPHSRYQNEKIRKKQLHKMIEDLNNYGYEFTFEDYLSYKDSFEEPDFQSTNPRDPNANNLENFDESYLERTGGDKLNPEDLKEILFKKKPNEEVNIEDHDEEEKEEEGEGEREGEEDAGIDFLKNEFSVNQKEKEEPPVDRYGNEFHKVNLITGADETPLEYGVRQQARYAKSLKIKIGEIKEMILDQDQDDIDREINQLDKKEFINNMARVSPFIKEDIYRAYLEGWTVKDLSYKYGLMPERIKAIVFDRDHFWKQIYPIIGESGFQKRLNEELEHAKRYGIWEYGKDLKFMAEREQGILLKQLSRGEIDRKPTKEHEEKISKALSSIKTKSKDHVTIGFYGKGAKGYAIKEMIMRKGQGKRRVSKMFEYYLHMKDFNPHLLPKKVIKKKEYGPRIATLGYRF